MAEFVSATPHGARADGGVNSGTKTTTSTETGGMAVVAFVCGLVGLLFGNILLGPAAIGLGITALRRGTTRRGRATLAIALGVADLAIFVLLALHSTAGHGGVTWDFSTF